MPLRALADFGGPARAGQTVSVFTHGTQTLATLVREDGSPAANPTTVLRNGQVLFYAEAGTYDIVGPDLTRTVTLTAPAAPSGGGEGGPETDPVAGSALTTHKAGGDHDARYRIGGTYEVGNVYGAKGDVRFGYATWGAATSTLSPGTFATGNQNLTFTQADVGKWVAVYAGGATASDMVAAQVTAVDGSGVATLSTPTGRAVVNGLVYIGTDDTAAIQQAINDAYASGGGRVHVPQGLYFANVRLYPTVVLYGDGRNTVLYSRPDGPGDVVGSSAADGIEPWYLGLHDITIHGMWNVTSGGPRVRGVSWTSINSDAFATPVSPLPWYAGDGRVLPVNDRQPFINNVLVEYCGGDAGVYLGTNMRSMSVDGLYVYTCRQFGMDVRCTDSKFTNVDSGGCGDGIAARGGLNQWSNCKSWYTYGTNTGRAATQGGVCWYVTGTGHSFDGCQSQDALTDGMLIDGATGISFPGFTSSGEGGVAVRLKGAKYCVGSVAITPNGDRQGQFNGIYFDGAATQYNVVHLHATIGSFGGLPGLDATGQRVAVANGASLDTNDVKVGAFRGVQRATLAAGATFTPDVSQGGVIVLTLNGDATIANVDGLGKVTPGTEVTFIVIQDATGGRTVTWGSQWAGAPTVNPVAGSVTTCKYVHTHTGPAGNAMRAVAALDYSLPSTDGRLAGYDPAYIASLVSPKGHIHRARALPIHGQGYGVVAKRRVAVTLAAGDNTVYTCPAGAVAFVSYIYGYNPTAGTVNLAAYSGPDKTAPYAFIGGFGFSAAQTRLVQQQGLLGPGDNLILTGTGLNLVVLIEEIVTGVADGLVVVHSNLAASANTVYTPPAGKSARAAYHPQGNLPLLVYNNTGAAIVVGSSYKVGAAAAMQFASASVAAFTTSNAGLADLHLEDGDSLVMTPAAVGVYFHGVFQVSP